MLALRVYIFSTFNGFMVKMTFLQEGQFIDVKIADVAKVE